MQKGNVYCLQLKVYKYAAFSHIAYWLSIFSYCMLIK